MLPAAGGHMTAGTRLFAAFSLTQISDKFPINVFICLLTYKPHGYSQVHAGAFGFNPKTTKWSDLHRSWHRITMPVFFLTPNHRFCFVFTGFASIQKLCSLLLAEHSHSAWFSVSLCSRDGDDKAYPSMLARTCSCNNCPSCSTDSNVQS